MSSATQIADQDGIASAQERSRAKNKNSMRLVLPSHEESFEEISLWLAITTYFMFGVLILISYLRELLRRWGIMKRWSKVQEAKVSTLCVGVEVGEICIIITVEQNLALDINCRVV
jgi:hypothetical protein